MSYVHVGRSYGVKFNAPRLVEGEIKICPRCKDKPRHKFPNWLARYCKECNRRINTKAQREYRQRKKERE